MIKVIAILTKKGFLSIGIQKDTQVNVFKLEDDKVIEYESIKLEDSDNNNFSMLLKIKDISLIYIDSINNELKNLLNKLGITIKCKDEWSEDKFINQFLFS